MDFKYDDKIPVLKDLGVGNIYIVYDTASSNASHLVQKYANKYYADGSKVLHPHTSSSSAITTNGLESALTACVTDRADKIIVMPSANTYYIDDTLTLDKKCVSITCPAALKCDVGCTNAARLQQITSGKYIFSIEKDGIEIAGFYMKNYPEYSHIQIPTGNFAWGNIIHHNYFVGRSASTSLGMLVAVGDGMSYSRIEKNWFTEQVSDATYASCITLCSAACTCDVIGNYISIGDGCIATVGILHNACKSIIADNYISECGGDANANGGTITVAITTIATNAVINNMCAVGTGQALSGGTAAHSFVHNMDGNSTYTANTNLET